MADTRLADFRHSRLVAGVQIWPANVGGIRYLTLAESSVDSPLYLGT